MYEYDYDKECRDRFIAEAKDRILKNGYGLIWASHGENGTESPIAVAHSVEQAIAIYDEYSQIKEKELVYWYDDDGQHHEYREFTAYWDFGVE